MIVYGKQPALFMLRRHPEAVHRVYLAKEKYLQLPELQRFSGDVSRIDARRAQSMSRGGNHQGILLETDPFETAPFAAIKGYDFVVVLDALTDVGNIGAIVRSAYALGADAVVATGVERLNFAAIVRSSAGALWEMPFVLRHNVADVLNELKQSGFTLYGATLEGDPIASVRFAPKRVLVLGSEGEGLSGKALRKLDAQIRIPMRRDFDSLNVSAAAAIFLERMSHAVT